MNQIFIHMLLKHICRSFRAIAVSFICCALFTAVGCSTPQVRNDCGLKDVSPAAQIISFYQGPLDHLSALRYGGCPMHPTCSSYAVAAIKKHGALIGWIMACDRLLRCGLDETRLSSEILVDANWKTVDTLEQNDFWWVLPQSESGPLTPFPPIQPGWRIIVD